MRKAGIAQGEGLTPVKAWNERLAEMDDADEETPWAEAVARLAAQGVLVIRHRFNPWAGDDREQSQGLYVQIRRATLEAIRPDLVAVSALSPLATALPEAWKNDVQVHAFATSRATRAWDAQRVIEELSAAMSEAIDRKEDRAEAGGMESTATSKTGEEL